MVTQTRNVCVNKIFIVAEIAKVDIERKPKILAF